MYTQQLGGYERMLNKHRELGISDEQRFRFASLMSLAADDAGMPISSGFDVTTMNQFSAATRPAR